ncbi:TPA: K(+)-transporting ATPase subunit F [Clostridioides difficile]|uniref:K(+)-transporting ATPase subunit F n=1 Tax=Clostridioides difficile TaxID=1496 RepID=A0A9P4DAZ5_CLODI|nr:potassium-transporting ATPase subunit F [Clostridioides difficile]MCC0684264.1 K(+)-transporting ATPase subunit F [Clostridioides sp. ZZV14-6345]MCC0692946.1 K(+)-transporting ATPase subunit F [Clostridioides sp. ZZV14-6387]MCC0698870.1 K(+)-transporting ATPase subunit F [Clostridioides sp. ZZV15-6383]HDN2469850.1 K(+)-transporting ATPase subunit F [Clostridioides difficile CD196]
MEGLPMWFLAVVIIMLIIYLVYALINPEKF